MFPVIYSLLTTDVFLTSKTEQILIHVVLFDSYGYGSIAFRPICLMLTTEKVIIPNPRGLGLNVLPLCFLGPGFE